MSTDTEITVTDATDHAWNLREAAIDYAVSIGAKQISIILDNGEDRVPWLNSLATRYGPHWSSDKLGDVRWLDGGDAIMVELAYQYIRRREKGIPNQQYDDPHFSRLPGTAAGFERRGFDLLIVATDKVPAHLIRTAGARHVFAVGVVPERYWICNAAIFPGTNLHAAQPIVLHLGGEFWSPSQIAAQLRGIADQFATAV